MTAPAKDNTPTRAGAPTGVKQHRGRADAAGTIAWAAAKAGVDLPVRVRAWDGSEAGPARRSPCCARRRRCAARCGRRGS